jgi:hypothetical protein
MDEGEENNVDCDQTGNVLEAAGAWSVSTPKLSKVFENCQLPTPERGRKGERKDN